MKTNKIYIYTAFALAMGLMLQSCKDNILTPVANQKPLDSLSALIQALNKTLVSVNAKDNTFKIQAAIYTDSAQKVANASPPPRTAQYTVYIIDGSNTVSINTGNRLTSNQVASCKTCKIAGVTGATVTVNTGGQSYTQVSADGRAVFNNILVAGDTKVLISAPGYTSCTIQTYIGSWSTAGNILNVSTAAMLFPTTGSSNVVYTGQIFMNTSAADDTLGRVHNQGPLAGQFLANDQPDGYDGDNYTVYSYGSTYGQNTYFDYSEINGYNGNIKFDKATVMAGINNIYAYPANVSNFYNAGGTYTLGDPITVEYTSGLASFLKVDANGVYTVSVPSYENEPGTYFGSNQNVQANYTYLFTASNVTGSTKINVNHYDVNTGTSTPEVWYSWTSVWDYSPFIQQDDGDGYGFLGHQTFNGLPGETVTRNIYLFAWTPDSTLPQRSKLGEAIKKSLQQCCKDFFLSLMSR